MVLVVLVVEAGGFRLMARFRGGRESGSSDGPFVPPEGGGSGWRGGARARTRRWRW